MAKKLKKKIEEICGLNDLDWEARQAKALEILNNNAWKQQLCNECVGLSFRDLERVLASIANERQQRSDEDKLVTYNENAKCKRQGNIPKLESRSLQQILAQVYAPRSNSELDTPKFSSLRNLRSTEKNESLFFDSDDEDGEP